MNIHTPERQPGESREAYHQRLRQSKRQMQAMTLAHIFAQRQQPSSRQRLRDSQRAAGHGPSGTFAFGIGNAAANKRLTTMQPPRYDGHGAVTLVGRHIPAIDAVGMQGVQSAGNANRDTVRRIWLAGISAQRGW